MQFRNLLIAACAALSMSTALADSRLVGEWNSLDANNGALKGSITIQKEGGAILAAESQPELVGTWKLKDSGELLFTMGEYGTANMKFRFVKDNLVLTYDNGNEQTFAKKTAAKKKAAPAKKAASAAKEAKK